MARGPVGLVRAPIRSGRFGRIDPRRVIGRRHHVFDKTACASTSSGGGSDSVAMLTISRLVAEIAFIAVRLSSTSRTVGPNGLPSCISTGPFERLSCGSSASLQRLPENLPLSGAAGSGRSRFDVGDFTGLGRCGIDRTCPRAPMTCRSSLRFFERSNVAIDRTIRRHRIRSPARQHPGPLSSRRWIAMSAFRRRPHARSIRPTIRRRFSWRRCTGSGSNQVHLAGAIDPSLRD
jgi:hypothetical protein